MIRKARKGVPPEICRRWLRRFEEDGESPPQIASADGFDVRTVRKQLQLALQEREQREAKQAVLRQALEQHYSDLCNLSRSLSIEFDWPPRHLSTFLMEDRLYTALQAHLPKSLLWKGIQKWETLVTDLDSIVEELRDRIRREVEARVTLPFTQSFWEGPGLLKDFVESIIFHLTSLACGSRGLEAAKYTRYQTSEELVQIRYGDYTLGGIHPERADEVQPVHQALMSEATGWEEYHRAKELYAELQQLRERLQDELVALTLRRVVPGRCRYCPF